MIFVFQENPYCSDIEQVTEFRLASSNRDAAIAGRIKAVILPETDLKRCWSMRERFKKNSQLLTIQEIDGYHPIRMSELRLIHKGQKKELKANSPVDAFTRLT